MIEKLLLQLGYVNKEKIEQQLIVILNEIRDEIDSNPKSANIGKKGCFRRIQKLFFNLRGVK